MPQQPDLILLGYGVEDALQLTVQTQRILSGVGKVYAVSLPPGLAGFLKSQRVQVEDLTDRFQPGRPFADCYLDVADHLFRRTAAEQPVCFLSPGNPLFLNALNRFIVMQAGQRGLNVQTYPGVSQIDAVISDIGLDVATPCARQIGRSPSPSLPAAAPSAHKPLANLAQLALTRRDDP